MRGYPTDAGSWVLPHLAQSAEHDRWMHVPKIAGPFGQSAGWRSFGWNLTPAAPKFPGTIIFMTDGRAISDAGSVMGYVAALKLDAMSCSNGRYRSSAERAHSRVSLNEKY